MTTPKYKLRTLKQSAKILTLFEDTPREQVQALLESGLLAVLCDANIAEIEHNEFRRICGLKSNVKGNFRYDKRKDDWELLKNAPRRLNSANIEGISFLKKKEAQINGEEMVRRAVKLDANLGQEDAEYLLEHQDEIPTKLREFFLVFPGTIWRVSLVNRFVPYLDWRDGQWVLVFCWLGDVWSSSGRLVRPRK